MRPATAAAMPEVSADFTTFTFRIKPGIHFADDPAFKGQKRELTAEDYVYSLKRHYDPRWKSANLYILESAKILGLSELRKKAHRREEALRLRHAGGRPAHAGPLPLPDQAGRAVAALPLQLHRRLLHRCAGARGGGVLRRPRRRASGGHRPLRAEGLEAQLAHRAGEEPPLPRRALRRDGAGRRRAAADRGAAVQGPQAAARRRGAHLGDRGTAAALAVVPEPGAGRHRERAGRLRHRGLPEQQAGAQPGQAGHPDGALPARRRRGVVFRHGAPGGRRLRAAQGGAAARHLAGGGHGPRDPPRAARPGHSRAGPDLARGLGLRPGAEDRDERLRPPARQGLARHARLRGPQRRRLARAARRPAAAAGVRHQPRPAEPPAHRAVEEEHGRHRRSAWNSRPPSGPRT